MVDEPGQPLHLVTWERRWFASGAPPAAASMWFFDAVDASVQAPRTDYYLAGTGPAIGVKWREGRFETKCRTACDGDDERWVKQGFAATERPGRLESGGLKIWIPVHKRRAMRCFSIRPAEGSTDPAEGRAGPVEGHAQPAEGRGQPVGGRIQPPVVLIEVAADDPGPGCSAELALLRLDDGEAMPNTAREHRAASGDGSSPLEFWTVGFEASGPPESESDWHRSLALTVRHVFERLDGLGWRPPEPGVLAGYPAWLHALTSSAGPR